MAEIGTVIAPSIGPNRDQTTPVRLVSCMMSSEEDIQTVQLAGSLDCAPTPGTQVLVLDVGLSNKIGLVLNDNVLPSAVMGEQFIYAMIASAIVSSVKARVDGTVVVNDGTDFAVAFNRMKTAFDSLADLVTTNLGLIATAISGLGGTYTITPLTPAKTSMNLATSPTVKIP